MEKLSALLNSLIRKLFSVKISNHDDEDQLALLSTAVLFNLPTDLPADGSLVLYCPDLLPVQEVPADGQPSNQGNNGDLERLLHVDNKLSTDNTFSRLLDGGSKGKGVFTHKGDRFFLDIVNAKQLLLSQTHVVDTLTLLLSDDLLGNVLRSPEGIVAGSSLHPPDIGPGVLMPVDILSMTLTSTTLHRENALLCSVNELLWGHPKVWLCARRHAVPVGTKLGAELRRALNSKWLHPGHSAVTIKKLLEYGFFPLIQKRGEVFITAPSDAAIHVTVSAGASLATAANCFFSSGSSIIEHLDMAAASQSSSLDRDVIDSVAAWGPFLLGSSSKAG
jgi:hypothetical protein